MNWLIWIAISLGVFSIAVTQISVRKLIAQIIYMRLMISSMMHYQVTKIAEELGPEQFKQLSDNVMNQMVDMNPPDIDKLLKDIFKKKGKQDGLGKD